MSAEAPAAKTLEELVAVWDELPIGVPQPVAANFCRYCESTDLSLVVRLEAVTRASLAGAQAQVSARRWPWLVCGGCGRESKGR